MGSKEHQISLVWVAGAQWQKSLWGECWVAATLDVEMHLEKQQQQESQACSQGHQKGLEVLQSLTWVWSATGPGMAMRRDNCSCTVAERMQGCCNKSGRAQRAALLNQWGCFLLCVCPELWECLCKVTQSTDSSLQLFRFSRFSIPKDSGH